jgi:ribonuclease HIII
MEKFNKPCSSRDEARSQWKLLMTGGSNPSKVFHSVHGAGLCYMSDVPSCCLNGAAVTLGIDEAGRGSILGPMTYGAAYWPTELAEEMEKKGFDDSKALTHEVR